MAQYRERLYWHIRRMVLLHEDADDVLQNTFIKIYRGVLQFEGKSKLYTWMYRIATNEAISHLQSKARNASESIDDTLTAMEPMPSGRRVVRRRCSRGETSKSHCRTS